MGGALRKRNLLVTDEIWEHFMEKVAFNLSQVQIGLYFVELKEHSVEKKECKQRQEEGRFILGT